jgi:NADH dehydrogenase
MAGQIAELAHRTLRGDFRRIDTTRTRVILLDAAPAVLGTFGEKLSRAAQDQLATIGVEVQLNVKVVGVDNTGVDVIDPDGSQRRIRSRCKVWAAGVSASPLGQQLAEQSGAEIDRAGRVKVNKDLTLPGHPEVYVVGDMIALDNLPGVAQVAMQGGKHVAGQIKRRLAGRRTGQRFRYFDKGSMATISRFSAVASIGKIQFSGFLAWLLWLFVHVMYLIGFKNRLTTMLHWAVSFLLRGRPQRTTTRQQIVARTLMARLTEAEEELKRARGDLGGDLPTPEEASELEGGTVVAESAEPKAHPI